MSQDSTRSSDCIRLSADGSEAVVGLAGGQPVSWRVDGRELLWSADPAHWPWHAPVLFPVVGQVKDGRVRIDGRSCEMPRHGFARQSRFRCVEQACDSVRLRLEPDAVAGGFPLPFRLDLRLALRGRSLSLDFAVSNPGDRPLPYAIGFHPAFPWPFDGGEPTAYEIRFEAEESALVPVITPDGLIARERRPIPLTGKRLPLAPELFRDDALVFLDAHSRAMRFEAPTGAAIAMRLDDFPHLAIWTKPGAPFLSLEAWTGHADPEGFEGEFADKPSMIRLAPAAQRRHRIDLSFECPEERDG